MPRLKKVSKLQEIKNKMSKENDALVEKQNLVFNFTEILYFYEGRSKNTQKSAIKSLCFPRLQ